MQDLKETLKSSDPASKWIDDFVKSDDPRFEGKSKQERKKMALGAYYSAIKESSEPHFLKEYTIKKSKRGVVVVHNGRVVHKAKSADRAQNWIESQAEDGHRKIMEITENIVVSALKKDFLGAESAFKKIMIEKVAQALKNRKQEIAKKLYEKAE